MGSQKRRRRKRSLLPGFSTIALLLVLGGAYYFFHEMYLVKEDRADQENAQYEAELVKNKILPIVTSINDALKGTEQSPEKQAAEMKNKLDSVYIANLDTFLLRNNRYEHFRNALEEQLILPRYNHQAVSAKVTDADKILQLLTEYEKIENHAVADSCVAIVRDLITNKK